MATKKSTELTPKQQKFVDVYEGNATEAARIAGYKGNSVTLGQVGNANLKNPQIAKAIRERQNKAIKPLIASREDRQAFWTEVMKDKSEHMNNRLKASELLGKSECDFTDKVELTGKDSGPLLILSLPDNGRVVKEK